jgi:hypothetical protein
LNTISPSATPNAIVSTIPKSIEGIRIIVSPKHCK